LLLVSSVFKRSPLLLLESVAGIPASAPMLASMLWFVSFLFLWQHYCYHPRFAVILSVTGIHAPAFFTHVAAFLPYSKSNSFYLSNDYDRIDNIISQRDMDHWITELD
jgi:hypothetical protein